MRNSLDDPLGRSPNMRPDTHQSNDCKTSAMHLAQVKVQVKESATVALMAWRMALATVLASDYNLLGLELHDTPLDSTADMKLRRMATHHSLDAQNRCTVDTAGMDQNQSKLSDIRQSSTCTPLVPVMEQDLVGQSAVLLAPAMVQVMAALSDLEMVREMVDLLVSTMVPMMAAL
jgi:hypothetical protein